MNVGGPTGGWSSLPRESDVLIVVFDPRKGKSVVSEGAQLKTNFPVIKTN